jgi:hypothetical protein
MSAPAPALGHLKIADNAISASYEVHVDVPRVNRGIVVQLRPRNFAETAAHFVRVTTAVKWPSTEHDID